MHCDICEPNVLDLLQDSSVTTVVRILLILANGALCSKKGGTVKIRVIVNFIKHSNKTYILKCEVILVYGKMFQSDKMQPRRAN